MIIKDWQNISFALELIAIKEHEKVRQIIMDNYPRLNMDKMIICGVLFGEEIGPYLPGTADYETLNHVFGSLDKRCEWTPLPYVHLETRGELAVPLDLHNSVRKVHLVKPVYSIQMQ